jgi:hypothetical protein
MVEAITHDLVSGPKLHQSDEESIAQHIGQTNKPPHRTRMIAKQLLFLRDIFLLAREKNSVPGDCSDFLAVISTLPKRTILLPAFSKL